MKNLKKVLNYITHPMITILLLLIISCIIVIGTLYEVKFGILAAHQKFYNSWLILFWGFVPFPGLRLLMSITFVHLLLSICQKTKLNLRSILLSFVHIGVLIFVTGALLSGYMKYEFTLPLMEGEISEQIYSTNQWTLVAFSNDPNSNMNPTRWSIDKLKKEQVIFNSHEKVTFLNRTTYSHENKDFHSQTGHYPIVYLKTSQQNEPIKIESMSEQPTALQLNGQQLYFQIVPTEMILPFKIQLIKFTEEKHPGSMIARSYESQVRVYENGTTRDVKIAMNRPFRIQGYSFFQSGFQIQDNKYVSVFAVVKNSGRLFPYIAGLILCFSLLFYFSFLLFIPKETKS